VIKYFLFCTIIIAPPAVDSIAARSIKGAIPLFEANSTPVVQVHSISCVASHTHPIVATVSNGLSREAAAILVLAGTWDIDRESPGVRSGHEAVAFDRLSGHRERGDGVAKKQKACDGAEKWFEDDHVLLLTHWMLGCLSI
jgi:hypothetical protein